MDHDIDIYFSFSLSFPYILNANAFMYESLTHMHGLGVVIAGSALK